MRKNFDSGKAEYLKPFCKVCRLNRQHVICTSPELHYGGEQFAGADVENEDGGSF